MSTTAKAGGEPRPDFLARFLAAVPLLVLYFALAALYAWQASRRVVPTTFTDELELTQLARAIAHTGEPARRGIPYPGLASLVAYVLAPVWWLGSVSASYAAAKLMLVLAMTATIFPAYGLARMVVPKWYALVAAGAAVAVPALAYAPILVEEPLAYPLATLALWLIARALEQPTRGRLAAAGAGFRRRDADPHTALDPLHGARARAPVDRLAVDARATLAVGVEPMGPRWRRDPGGRHRVGLRRDTGTSVDRVAGDDVHLEGADRRARDLVGRRARNRDGRPPRDRRSVRARATEGRGERPSNARIRRHERRRSRGLRRLCRGEGRVHLDRLRDAGRRAEPHLPLPRSLRSHGTGVRARDRARLGDRRSGRLHADRRRGDAAPSGQLPVLRGARALGRRAREPQVRVA